MEQRMGFTKFTIAEFENWVASVSIARTINRIQEHHTWSPNYGDFTGSNHFDMQQGMKNYHINTNGWSDIGQHFSIFPDGAILTGRPANRSPACIYGNNQDSICIENVGDFDAGRDQMRPEQRESIIRATAALARRFGLTPVTTNNIVYHHWFDLSTGARTNGTGQTKSCPGTAFFGGNSVEACVGNFLPLVQAALGGPAASVPIAEYRRATASLRVRQGPSVLGKVVRDQAPLDAGAVIRVFDRRARWLKISNSKEHWVSDRRTRLVARAIVNTDDSSVRSGPSTEFSILSSLMSGTEVFVDEVAHGWARIGIGHSWIHASLIDVQNA